MSRPFRQWLHESYLYKMDVLRTAYWRFFLKSLGPGSRCIGPVWFGSPELISVGRGCTFNRGAMINARAPITIGNYVRISSYAVINAGGLDYSAPRDNRGHIEAPVVIKDGVWIGAGAIIGPGVTIGEDAVIGAGSVVVKDVPPRVLMFGSPARVVRTIKEGESKEEAEQQP